MSLGSSIIRNLRGEGGGGAGVRVHGLGFGRGRGNRDLCCQTAIGHRP